MGKAEVFRIPVLVSFFRALGGFPVDRDGTDRKALRDSIAMLQAGDRLVVFPEGTRQNGTEDPAAAAGRGVPGAAGRRADRAGRDRGHRGDPAQQWPALVPAVRPRGDRRRRADRAAGPRPKSTVPRAEVDALTAQLAEALQQTFDEAWELARSDARRPDAERRGLTGRARRAPRTRRARGRRRTVRRRARACFGSPPNANAAAASSAGINSRSSRGGGKYSSSSVTRTASTPCTGASFAITARRDPRARSRPRSRRRSSRRRARRGRAPRGRRPGARSGSRRPRATFVSAIVFDEFALPITTTASAAVAIRVSAVWRLVVAKQRSLRDAVHSCREALARLRRAGRSTRCARASSARASRRVRGRRPVASSSSRCVLPLDEVDRVGRDRERADGFVVAGVADVEHREALAGAHLRFVVHLGDERAHRVHDVATLRARGRDDLGRRAVRRQHQRRAGRHVGDVVDEDHALLAEPLDDEPVVDDLVVAVHGRLERAHHPRRAP